MNVACGCWIPEEQQRARAPLEPQKEMNSSALFEGTCKWQEKKIHRAGSHSPAKQAILSTVQGLRQIPALRNLVLFKNMQSMLSCCRYYPVPSCLLYTVATKYISISMNSLIKVFAWLIFQVNDSLGTWGKDLCQWYTGSANCQRVLLCN